METNDRDDHRLDSGLRGVDLNTMNSRTERQSTAATRSATSKTERFNLIGGPAAGMPIPIDSDNISKDGLSVWIPSVNGDARYTRPSTDEDTFVFEAIDQGGRMTDTKIWTRALTDSEIQSELIEIGGKYDINTGPLKS
jgi:hypothetical protein